VRTLPQRQGFTRQSGSTCISDALRKMSKTTPVITATRAAPSSASRDGQFLRSSAKFPSATLPIKLASTETAPSRIRVTATLDGLVSFVKSASGFPVAKTETAANPSSANVMKDTRE